MDSSSLKVAVIGNCQAEGFAHCLRHVTENTSVQAFPLNTCTLAERINVAETLGSFDVILSQNLLGDEFGPLKTELLATALGSKLVMFPAIGFRGLHPDFIYLFFDKRPLRSPAWTYHSSIAVAAYKLGMARRQALTLFNTFVFAALGHYDEFPSSCGRLEKNIAELGYSLDTKVSQWTKPFMHTIDHPCINMIYALAVAVSEKLGLIAEGISRSAPDGLIDQLAAGAQLPVYPDLAKRIGFQGGLRFKRDDRHIAARGLSQTLDLEQFIDESYTIYSAARKEFLIHPTVGRAEAIIRQL